MVSEDVGACIDRDSAALEEGELGRGVFSEAGEDWFMEKGVLRAETGGRVEGDGADRADVPVGMSGRGEEG